jgi:hypothetical protein
MPLVLKQQALPGAYPYRKRASSSGTLWSKAKQRVIKILHVKQGQGLRTIYLEITIYNAVNFVKRRISVSNYGSSGRFSWTIYSFCSLSGYRRLDLNVMMIMPTTFMKAFIILTAVEMVMKGFASGMSKVGQHRLEWCAPQGCHPETCRWWPSVGRFWVTDSIRDPVYLVLSSVNVRRQPDDAIPPHRPSPVQCRTLTLQKERRRMLIALFSVAPF